MPAPESVMERLGNLESDLRGFVFGGLSTDEVNAAIHRHTMLVAREGHLAGWVARSENAALHKRLNQQDATARELFPLLPKKVLRIEPDPHGTQEWCCQEEELYVRPMGGEFRPCDPEKGFNAFTPTPQRVRLWAGLMASPYTEVPGEGDE